MPEQLSRLVAEELRRLLAERGISGNQLAKRTGIPQPTIATKLSGKSAWTLDDLQVVCAQLDVSVADLLQWAHKGHPSEGLLES